MILKQNWCVFATTFGFYIKTANTSMSKLIIYVLSSGTAKIFKIRTQQNAVIFNVRHKKRSLIFDICATHDAIIFNSLMQKDKS
jgi:hypothetical protein